MAGAPWSLCDDSLILSFRGGAGDEESRTALKILRARFLAEFTLSTQSEIPSLRSGRALRFAQDDSEGLGMTVLRRCHTDSLGGHFGSRRWSQTKRTASGVGQAQRISQ